MLRRIFGRKREEVVGGWRRLHNEELHNLYISPNIISVIKSKRMRCARYVAGMKEMRNVYKILVVKPEGKRPLGGLRRRWGDNIRMDLRGIWREDVDWTRVDQDRDQWWAVVNTGA
jgi:hypothetical protein